jgi:hypothetical protein
MRLLFVRHGSGARSHGGSAPARPNAAAESDGWQEERITVELGAGETHEIVLRCAFKPERVIVDPDARVLQLKREKAVTEL